MQDSNNTLKLEVKQLSTGVRSNVRRAMFPELFSSPTGRFGLVFISTFYERAAKWQFVVA